MPLLLDEIHPEKVFFFVHSILFLLIKEETLVFHFHFEALDEKYYSYNNFFPKSLDLNNFPISTVYKLDFSEPNNGCATNLIKLKIFEGFSLKAS